MENFQYELLHYVDIKKIKSLDYDTLEKYAFEVREFLINTLSTKGGHLSSNLAVVELTIALFRIFDSPNDKFIWDIGHQTYVHKIITGRFKEFNTIREYKGLSGFIKRSENIHDIWEAGHASTALSASCGISMSNRLLNEYNKHIISIVGDGSLTGGMSLEALNNIGYFKLPNIIILNDNEMSISKNVGALQIHINELRLSKSYLPLKSKIIKFLGNENLLFKKISNFLIKTKKVIKKSVFNEKANFFTSLGFNYIGPIDGHNLKELENTLSYAKKITQPIIIHISTKKGKGFKYAENDISGSWHGVGKFSLKDGLVREKNLNFIDWSQAISNILEKFMDEDENITITTPAMIVGSKLSNIEKKYPNRLFDVAIAEEHAMTFNAGLSLQGKIKPFLSIYSTFLQRCYDQLIHDVVMQNLPIIVGVDRCGFANGDGQTHHGIYDLSLTLHIPNIIVTMPKDIKQARNLLYSAFYFYKKPFIIRYPRGYIKNINFDEWQDKKLIPIGEWEFFKKTKIKDIVIISYGNMLQTINNIVDNLSKNYNISIVNAFFLKPLDYKMLQDIYSNFSVVIIVEEVCKIGSLGSYILSEIKNKYPYKKTFHYAIEDKFFAHGDRQSLLKESELDEKNLLIKIKDICKKYKKGNCNVSEIKN